MLILSKTQYRHYSFYALIIFVYSIKVIKKAPIESEPLSIIPKYNYFKIPICFKNS